jgi:protein PhnA
LGPWLAAWGDGETFGGAAMAASRADDAAVAARRGWMSSEQAAEFVYDEETGEWISAAEAAAKARTSEQPEVLDAVGNVLADGDSVTLVKDLKVKGANQTLKRGTVIRSIRLTGDAQEIDCRHETIKGLVLRAEFVRKL